MPREDSVRARSRGAGTSRGSVASVSDFGTGGLSPQRRAAPAPREDVEPWQEEVVGSPHRLRRLGFTPEERLHQESDPTRRRFTSMGDELPPRWRMPGEGEDVGGDRREGSARIPPAVSWPEGDADAAFDAADVDQDWRGRAARVDLRDRWGGTTPGPRGHGVQVRQGERSPVTNRTSDDNQNWQKDLPAELVTEEEDTAYQSFVQVSETVKRDRLREEVIPSPRPRIGVLREERLSDQDRTEIIKAGIGDKRQLHVSEHIPSYAVSTRTVERTVTVERDLEQVEIVYVPEIIEKPVPKDVEIRVEKPREVSTQVHRIEQVEEIPGDVVYFDRIIEVPCEKLISQPEVIEVPKLMPRTIEIVHHIPKFVEVEQEVHLIVQRPVKHVVERTVQVPRIIPREIVEEREVEICEEIPTVEEEEVVIPRKVQVPRWNRRELIVEVPRIKIEEVVLQEAIQVTKQTVVEKPVIEAMHEVEVIRTLEREHSVVKRKPKIVEVPKIQYEERRIERPVYKYVDVDIPGPTCEVVKRKVKVPRVEYRDKVVHVPYVRDVRKQVQVENEVREHEVHNIVAERDDPAVVQYLEQFVDMPQIRHEVIEIPCHKVKEVVKYEEVPIIQEVIKYEEVIQYQDVKVVRETPVYVQVPKIYKIPKYVFQDVVEYKDIYEEHLVESDVVKEEVVEKLVQEAKVIEEKKVVTVAKRVQATAASSLFRKPEAPVSEWPTLRDPHSPDAAAGRRSSSTGRAGQGQSSHRRSLPPPPTAPPEERPRLGTIKLDVDDGLRELRQAHANAANASARETSPAGRRWLGKPRLASSRGSP